MIGTIVNSIAIIFGCIIGIFIKGSIPKRLSNTIMNGMALCVLYIGISGSLKGENTLVTIISMAVGALIGELIDIDDKLSRLGNKIGLKISKNESDISISQGFVSATLIFCVGAMAVVGSLESGLLGNHETLFTKSILDGITAIIFTASMGIGVIFSSVAVFLYQGFITIGATILSSILNDSVINSMTAVGSLLIIGLSLNMLKCSNIKVANLLPAMFIPIFISIFGII
ncbi:MAG: DUF554 domain-containing protein [Romboutsia sp.]